MKAVFTYLTGGRSGQAVSIEKTYAMLGRSPQADIRFGPDQDLVVSARHAAVVYRGGAWILRDLASTNGTFVNGTLVQGEQALADQDLIRLGDGGPILRFGLMQASWGSAVPLNIDPDTDAAGVPAGAGTEPTTTVPRTPVATAADDGHPLRPAPTPRTRAGGKGVLAVAALGLAILALSRWPRGSSTPPLPLAGDRAELLAQADSLFAALEGVRASDQLVGRALTSAKAETARLRSRIRRAPASRSSIAALKDTLAQLRTSQARIEAAAALDVASIVRTHQPSVVAVIATYADGSTRTAAAVATTRRGRPGLLTTRAVTMDADGAPATLALLVQPTGELRTTRVLRSNPALDLALLELPAGTRLGNPPTLAGTQDISSGQAAIVLGFPENKARSADAGPLPSASPTASLGAVALDGRDAMELELFGSTLAPGSPVFDGRGQMLGVILGYSPTPLHLRALPATSVSRFLAEGVGAR